METNETVNSSKEHSMAQQIDYKLVGDDMQAVIITLDPGETVQAESGAMMFICLLYTSPSPRD